MGQFKPMVKMETTEPSVILKLKKGGHVAMNRGGEYGYANMRSKGMATMPDDRYTPPAAAPKAPSVMARRAAMAAPLMKKGGKMEKHEDAAQDRAMIKKAMAGKKFASGGTTKVVDGDKTDKAHGTGDVKMGKAAGYKTGGTIEGNEGKFKNTKVVDGDKHDSASGTGKVRMSNAGGFKDGGSTNWENRPANSAKPGKSNTTTGEVKEANAGGYKRGGSAKKHFATGGSVNDAGHAVAMPRKPVSKPVSNTAQSGTFAKGGKVEKEEKPNLRLLKTHTGPKGDVAKVYKDKDWGEHRVKFFDPDGKHRSESDYHTDDLSDAHDTAQSQLNRYKKGGKVMHKADGGLTDLSRGAYDKSIGPGEDEMEMANAIRNAPSDAMNAVMRLLGKKPSAGAGRGFVNPPVTRKSGGQAKC